MTLMMICPSDLMPKNGQVFTALVAIPSDANDCWEWQGKVNASTGYGHKQWHGKTVLAHRWVFELLQGPIPDGLVINHKCSNPKCVNPSHLEVTDQAGNCRHGAGTKLEVSQVKEIKAAKVGKKWGDATRLAKRFNVSPALIHDIWSGRAWAEIMSIRKKKKATNSQRAFNAIGNQLTRAVQAGYSFQDCMDVWERRQWKGFELAWYESQRSDNNATSKHPDKPRSAADKARAANNHRATH